ncbi:MAG: ROK family protein [Leptolinea sp.]|nr:ROK family protein [Leptolinea sp.]
MKKYFGGIEAGGTKFVCNVASSPDDVLADKRFPTTDPVETIAKAIAFFQPYIEKKQVEAIGIAAFGPVDLDARSKTFGYITTTPKPGWAQVDLLGTIQRALRVPCAFDTDVNGAAQGEYYWNLENRELDPLLYITVGTGIGVGGIVNGKTLHGLIHPEAGHMFIPHNRETDPFPGACPYHEDCLEGLASGPSMAKRWGQPAETLPDDHPGWNLEAMYIGYLISNLVLTLSPKRIILGGGVPQHPGLVEKVRSDVKEQLNGYIQSQKIMATIDEFIVPPSLGSQAGVMGAIAMAKQLVER